MTTVWAGSLDDVTNKSIETSIVDSYLWFTKWAISSAIRRGPIVSRSLWQGSWLIISSRTAPVIMTRLILNFWLRSLILMTSDLDPSNNETVISGPWSPSQWQWVIVWSTSDSNWPTSTSRSFTFSTWIEKPFGSASSVMDHNWVTISYQTARVATTTLVHLLLIQTTLVTSKPATNISTWTRWSCYYPQFVVQGSHMHIVLEHFSTYGTHCRRRLEVWLVGG